MESCDPHDETSKLLDPTKYDSSYTNVGIPSTVLEPPNVYKSRWRSIRVMYLTMFLSSVSFSVCMTSVWPFLQHLDNKSTADFLGWVVASYSIGQLISSPLFGWWSNFTSNSRVPIAVSLVISVLANLLYAYLQDFTSPTSREWLMVAARSLIGFGAGNTAVVRSYVSGATTLKERTATMANISAFQAIGFIIGPAIQAALAPLGYPGPVNLVEIRINIYTAPAWLSAVLCVVNIVMVLWVFTEHRVMDDDNLPSSIQTSSPDLLENIPDYKPDYVACAFSLILFFETMFTFGTFETITTPLTEDMYNWLQEQAALYCGIMLAGTGVISIMVFIAIKALSRRVNERYLIIAGFLVTSCGFFTWLPWGNNHLSFQITALDPAKTLGTNTTAYPLPISNTTIEPVGCPIAYEWCKDTPQLYMEQMFAGCFLVAVGYPTCNVLLFALYSKILGPKPQGTMMGWMSASGSAARVLGPIAISQLYAQWGPRVSFSIIAGLNVLSAITLIIMFKRLVPFSLKKKPVEKA